MRILRSQYLKSKTNATGPAAASTHTYEAGKKLSPKKRKSVNNQNLLNTTSPPENGSTVRIHIDNIESLDNLNVVVEFVDMDAMWLTRVYQSYENELWHRKPRCNGGAGSNQKWYFYCRLCDNVYCRFHSIKRHLNMHLKFYPYVCKLCAMKYTGRYSATRHLRRTHRLAKTHWSDYLTS